MTTNKNGLNQHLPINETLAKSDNTALHILTRQAEQALKAQQNNPNNEVKPKEIKK